MFFNDLCIYLNNIIKTFFLIVLANSIDNVTSKNTYIRKKLRKEKKLYSTTYILQDYLQFGSNIPTTF